MGVVQMRASDVQMVGNLVYAKPTVRVDPDPGVDPKYRIGDHVRIGDAKRKVVGREWGRSNNKISKDIWAYWVCEIVEKGFPEAELVPEDAIAGTA